MTKYLAVFQNENIPQAFGISGQGLVVLDASGKKADEYLLLKDNLQKRA